MDQHTILLTIAVAVILGASGQILASLTRMPAIVYLLILGILAGPYVLGEHALVKPRSLGKGLPIITSAFVAIILFEGGLSLRPSLLRDSIQAVRRLITVGAAVSLIGTAVLAKLILGVEWSHAFLFASLIVVTGPTVIAPILRRVRLRQRLHAVLKSESILIDPIGVIIAIVVLQYVVDMVSHEASWSRALMGFFGRAGYGIAIGAAMGVAAVLLFRLPVFRQRHNQHLITLGAVGLALGAFALGEVYYSESGLMAVTVAGLIVAAAPLPFREELEHFKEQVTILGVSVLFILLAANVNLGLLRAMGHKEVLLILGLIFLVRPLSVWVSTVGTSLTWREKNYISLMAPRGIVAAAMASYFADQLREHDLRAAQLIESMVFLTIAATVCIQGTWASWLARFLKVRAVRPRGILLVGVNEWSLAVAETAESLDLHVKLLDTNPALCEAARQRGFDVIEGDGTNVETYERIDLSHIGALVSMTPNDAVNTLACEAAAPWLDEDHVYQIVSKPMGNGARSSVRLAGRRAMPSASSHSAISFLLQQKQLRTVHITCATATPIEGEVLTEEGRMLPLFLVEGDRCRLALEGVVCPAGGILVGLVGWPTRSAEPQGLTAFCPSTGIRAPAPAS